MLKSSYEIGTLYPTVNDQQKKNATITGSEYQLVVWESKVEINIMNQMSRYKSYMRGRIYAAVHI